MDESVYDLITQLCERFSNDSVKVKKLRTRSYEILLNTHKSTLNISKAPDPYCDLLAWQFTLVTKYGLFDHASGLKEFGEYVRQVYGPDIITLLLCLRQIPSENDEENWELGDFLRPCEIPNFSSTVSSLSLEMAPSIWEFASKSDFSFRKNWEDFGRPEPDKEKPFLSELGELAHLWVENLPSVYHSATLRNQKAVKPRVVTVREFIKDLKYLLVGLVSDSFVYENGGFHLIVNFTVQGLTPANLQNFSKEFISCGNCCKALYELSMTTSHSGYIFAELCKSLQSYLEFYRSAILSLPDTIGLVTMDDRTRPLRRHLSTLAFVCKVGEYSEGANIPHGVLLLNYLYQAVLNLTDKNVLMVLYSILFPCCQVYFARFLQPWLLEGVIDDPYEEFFIKPNVKYISNRGRAFWTRSFALRQEIVPDFWIDLRMDILNCGKAMNLLKLCGHSSKLVAYLRGKKPLIISCCLTSEQVAVVEQNSTSYYLEILAETGHRLNLSEIIKRKKQQDPAFLDLIAKKRALALERIELERKRRLAEQREKKLDEISMLKEQYDSALEQKQARIATEIESEIKQIEFNLNIETMRDKLIEKEATEMIEYYTNLCETADKRRNVIEKHIENMKKNIPELEAVSSEESFYSIINDEIIEEENAPLHSSKSLDIINANNSEDKNVGVLETFALAQQIKKKVMAEEMDMDITLIPPTPEKPTKITSVANLTEAQRNKLRVLNSEFGIDITRTQPTATVGKKAISQVAVNRNFMLSSNECFYYAKQVDNVNFVNKNLEGMSGDGERVAAAVAAPTPPPPPPPITLSLDLNKIEMATPMSVDSTPLTEFSNSIPNTAETHATDEGCPVFDDYNVVAPSRRNFLENCQFSKRMPYGEASGLKSSCLPLCLNESVSIPVATQTKLANDELLRLFVIDLDYLGHLSSLRDYFFLQNGEFGRTITENLFEELYNSKCPNDLINCGTLNNLVFEALKTSKTPLSFKINSLPKSFHLGDPHVLDCLSLSYTIQWPLNILLPGDTINKYNEVFKYLLKLHRISWVLKRVGLELKILAKVSGKNEIYLMVSPHFRRLHQCRHILLHFVQTLQNYIEGEVLQSSWESFEVNLASVCTLDGLYYTHTTYLKNILFLCLLNQKSAPLLKVIQKIFVVILKFYDHLRSRSWECQDGFYVHPNFVKLESIFENFRELVLYLFKVGRKVATSGYQPHLTQLLDMLDINGYYSKNK